MMILFEHSKRGVQPPGYDELISKSVVQVVNVTVEHLIQFEEKQNRRAASLTELWEWAHY